jgi:hypothetical protein
MIDKLCGFVKRAWYLIAFVLSITLIGFAVFYWIQGIGYVTDTELLSQLNQDRVGGYDYVHSNSDVIRDLVEGLVVLPIAYAVHRAVRWVFFG